MSLLRTLGVALAFPLANWVALSAQASDGPSCGEFTAYHEHIEAMTVDNGEPGMGVGDERYGRSRLVDENGNEIGQVYWRSSVMPGSKEGAFLMNGHGQTVFQNGTTTHRTHYHMSDPAAGGMPIDLRVGAIIGGTGEFAGARGVLTWLPEGQGRRKLAFDIECLP